MESPVDAQFECSLVKMGTKYGCTMILLMMILYWYRIVDDDETGGWQVWTEGTDDTSLGSQRLLIGRKVAEC